MGIIYNQLCSVLEIKDPKDLYKNYSKEINEQILKFNIVRIEKIVWILLFLNSMLTLTESLFYRSKLFFVPSYEKVFYLRISLFPILLFYLFLFHKKSKNTNICRYANTTFNVAMVVWSELMCLNAISLHSQASAYLIAMFSMAALIITPPVQSLTIYPASFISFVIGLFIIKTTGTSLYGYIINSFLMVVISLFASIIGYTTFCWYVINQQIIADKNREIDALNSELLKKIQLQTNELVKVNSSLELEKLRVSLFANISHEFKTPINVILSAEQLMEYTLKDNAVSVPISFVKKYMFSIKQNCYRLIRLVSNIIDINTIDCGNMNLRLSNRDIVKTTEDIVLCVADYIKDKNYSLIFDTEMEERIIAIDPEKMERVILNLLSNALKFTPPGGSINVNIFERNNSVVISVKDTGIGIPDELQSAIFDRLVQVDRSFTKNSEGSGIGLSIAKSIIDMHKGRIYVKSRLGAGSEFFIELPAYTIDGGNSEAAATYEQDIIEKIKIEFSDIYI